VCIDGRCQEAPARAACTKDVECPGVEVCERAGFCASPRVKGAPATAGAGVLTASLDRSRTGDLEACRNRCGDEQESCSRRADQSAIACKRNLVAEPRYAECQCPRWPSGRLDCYQFCKETYESSKSCEAMSASAGAECLATAARCASNCQ